MESGRYIRHGQPVRALIILATVAFGIAAAAAYAGNRHDDRLWRDCKQVRPGMSAAEAEAILGEPSWHDRCGAKFPYGHEKGCVTELGYRSAFAPINPRYWVIELDGRGRVISSDWIASP